MGGYFQGVMVPAQSPKKLIEACEYFVLYGCIFQNILNGFGSEKFKSASELGTA